MGRIRAETLGRELAHALRTGPFSAALHLAIEASGLRLEEIQEKLAAHQLSVGLTTLSYWRRGRSRPERPESLRAVQVLEEILGLPPESLTVQLGPRRPRGQWLAQAAGTLELEGLFAAKAVSKLVDDIDSSMSNRLSLLSVHDACRLGADRQELSMSVRQVFRANIDRVSRCVVVYRMDDPGPSLPSVHAVSNCRIGRVRTDQASGFLAAELIFDRVLSTGETVAPEYELTATSPQQVDCSYHAFGTPVGEYLLQVQFDPAAVPARCFRYERRALPAPDQGVKELWIGNTHAAHLFAVDVPAGVIGMRWEWE